LLAPSQRSRRDSPLLFPIVPRTPCGQRDAKSESTQQHENQGANLARIQHAPSYGRQNRECCQRYRFAPSAREDHSNFSLSNRYYEQPNLTATAKNQISGAQGEDSNLRSDHIQGF
jgi:hypothetical protein